MYIDHKHNFYLDKSEGKNKFQVWDQLHQATHPH